MNSFFTFSLFKNSKWQQVWVLHEEVIYIGNRYYKVLCLINQIEILLKKLREIWVPKTYKHKSEWCQKISCLINNIIIFTTFGLKSVMSERSFLISRKTFRQYFFAKNFAEICSLQNSAEICSLQNSAQI